MWTRVAPHETQLGGKAQEQLHATEPDLDRGPAQWCVPPAFERGTAEVTAAFEQTTVLRNGELMQRTTGRKRQTDTRVTNHGHAGAREDAVCAVENR